jgi:hypothetical protein
MSYQAASPFISLQRSLTPNDPELYPFTAPSLPHATHRESRLAVQANSVVWNGVDCKHHHNVFPTGDSGTAFHHQAIRFFLVVLEIYYRFGGRCLSEADAE